MARRSGRKAGTPERSGPSASGSAKRGRQGQAAAGESRITKLARARVRQSAATRLLGFDVAEVSEGRAVLRMDAVRRHKQIHGVVHGGILAALADTAAAVAAYTTIPKGTELATIELKINYLEPVAGGRVTANARVLRTGRNFVVTECEIMDGDGTLAAKALLTFGAASGSSLARQA